MLNEITRNTSIQVKVKPKRSSASRFLPLTYNRAGFPKINAAEIAIEKIISIKKTITLKAPNVFLKNLSEFKNIAKTTKEI